jgi:protein-disulfide isomerase
MNDRTSPKKGSGSRWRRVAIVAACLCLVAAGAVYYWLFSWSSGYFAAARGRTPEGLPWIGAASPELTIHEYVDYECPHCLVAHKWVRRALLFHQGDVRLVRHDYARMQCRAGAKDRPPRSCELVRGGICAADQGAFWRWNDAVMSDPRPLSNPARDAYPGKTARAIGLDGAAFDACLVAPKTIDRAQAIWSAARRDHVSDTPTYVVDGKRMGVAELAALLDERL